jgi:hypothetical protein
MIIPKPLKGQHLARSWTPRTPAFAMKSPSFIRSGCVSSGSVIVSSAFHRLGTNRVQFRIIALLSYAESADSAVDHEVTGSCTGSSWAIS